MGGEPAKTGPRDDDYPLIARRIAGDSDSVAGTRPADVRFSVTMDDGDDAHVADHAARIAAAGGCVLCIANTVAKAQTWYDAVKGVMSADAFQVGLLHSKFPAFRREELENEWLGKLGKDGYGRPKGCVLVGTQVLEQSVDIDADCLVTELAPTDMLLQRMGRVWRHKRGPRGHGPEVRILCGNAGAAEDVDELRVALGGKSCLVYQPYVLWRSWQVWSVLSAVRLPSDVPALLRRTYCDPPEPEPQHVVELKEILDREARKLEQYANAARADVRMPTREDDERVTTRYSDRPMQDVLLVRTVDSTGRDAGVELLEEGSPLRLSADRKDFPATVRLHRHLVSVPAYVLGSLARPGVPPWLKMHFHLHDAPPIWTLASDGAQLMMCSKPTGFTYDRWHGLRRLDSEKAAPSAFDEYQDEEFEE
jgi:CRISPR-associated endonuclease/helicase Cas3